MSDLISIRQFKDSSSHGESLYENILSEDLELLPEHQDILRVRNLLQMWMHEQLGAVFFCRHVLAQSRVLIGYFLWLILFWLLPIKFQWRTFRNSMYAIVFLQYPVVIYLLHRLSLEQQQYRSLGINDQRNVGFNYMTGGVFLVEALVPSSSSVQSGQRNIEFQKVLIGFGAYRAWPRDPRNIADLRYVYIHPSFRRRGIAGTLVQKMAGLAKRQGFQAMTCSIDSYLGISPFMLAQGFSELSVLPHHNPIDQWLQIRGQRQIQDLNLDNAVKAQAANPTQQQAVQRQQNNGLSQPGVPNETLNTNPPPIHRRRTNRY